MAQHITVRVPWHDNGWNGEVCQEPSSNNACLRLKNIYENRNDVEEDRICSKCMLGLEDKLPCIGEGAAFMSPVALYKTVTHPYIKSNPKTHGHFKETDIIYPPYSLPARPYAWLMKGNIQNYSEIYNIQYNPDIEPLLNFKTNWIQEANNHKAIFDYFYRDVKPNDSLCIVYAKQVPFVEDSRRVVMGMGHVTRIIPAVEHANTKEKPLRSLTWETMICHSIREEHEDGFVIPYQQMMKYAETHPDFDMKDITVFAPYDAFEEFSYATEHVGYDAIIEVILSCIKAFGIINNCLDEDYSNVISWLNERLAEVWGDRGAFPGLGPMLCAIEMPLGVLIAKEIKERIEESEIELWDYVDCAIKQPKDYLSSELASKISPIIQKTWKGLSEERKTLFKLLSRFSLTIEQARTLFNQNERQKKDIICSDKEIIENPYILYEQTRLKTDKLYISVKKVDRAVFPVMSIREKYPMTEPSKLTSDNDERRVRAIAIAVLENEANNGNTILPCTMLVDEIQNLIIEPECKVTLDILNAIEKFLKQEIIKREMKDGTDYYKLVRLNEFDEIIEKRIGKRLKANKLEVNANWRKMVDDKFSKGKKVVLSKDEEDARKEKAAALKELAKSRISVLVGDAGTGKTSVLSILCSEPSIKAGGVLLLAPTGKATVRLMESIGESGKTFSAMNVAQFLVRSKRFDWNDMRYKLSDFNYRDVPETVIIDESSMLTEEMFGALMQALKSAKRIIFVGDPNQLPPIGAGRPFVDLVYLLKGNLLPNLFPKVCDSYGELTVNRRQETEIETERMDVALSKLFTSTADYPDEDIVSEIDKDNNNIYFEKWETKEELESKLLQIMADEIGMKSVDDQDGFDKSLGGEETKYGIYFNMGSAKFADKWQILAPVRNMPQGVMNINRLLHLKYRERYLDISKRWGKYKRIPKMLGPESIVYGDKVINVVNSARDAYPKENALNYVANGEIGIACNSYSSKNPNDYLHVEFSSQKGFNYSYDSRDFSDEKGTANLELAYALTVHKSQGSQFDTVILVLAEPCRIISRELLYTALTRQTKKIIILYNKDAYHLLKYTSEAYSDIARRFTDLFADVFKDDGSEYKPQIVKVGNDFYEDRLIHRTAKGEMVRSKSEVVIANCLYYNKLEYVYEPELVLEGKIKRPDFMIIDDDTGEKWYWEHCGMMTDTKYVKRWEDKKKFYEKNGIKEGKNLIVTYDDEKGGLDSSLIDKMVKDIFDWR
jgi:ATP-dependent exoDNAse (exonuclease V) alpha subunit